MPDDPVAVANGMARGLVCLTFDNMGKARDVGAGEATRPDRNEPGLLIGYPRILDLLDELSLRGTFFVEGWNGLHHPERVRELVDRGHEVGLHGWIHEKWAQLSSLDRERLFVDGDQALRRAGANPVGFRAPGGLRGEGTTDLLSEFGYAYDSSANNDGFSEPEQINLTADGIVNIPWTWSMIDFWHYRMHPEGARTAVQLREDWLAKLDYAAENKTVVTLIIHAFVSGIDDAHLEVVRDVLQAAQDDTRLDILPAGIAAQRFSAKSIEASA